VPFLVSDRATISCVPIIKLQKEALLQTRDSATLVYKESLEMKIK
jgi:hypothetical protein